MLILLIRSVMLKLTKTSKVMSLITLTVLLFGHLLPLQNLAIFPLNNFQEITVSLPRPHQAYQTPYSHLEGTEADEKGISCDGVIVWLPTKKSAG
jgi:hypothetical protein